MNGFTPVCVLSCFLSSHDVMNAFPQVPHVKGFTPVCILSCILSKEGNANDFHRYHKCKFSHHCVFFDAR